jgi:putative ABC transport system substrate-binding protein
VLTAHEADSLVLPRGARRGVRLDSPAVILNRGAMQLIGLVLALSLILAPLTAGAQQSSGLPRIVVLSVSSSPDVVRVLEEGLRTLGYIPGETIAIDHRSADARTVTLPARATEAVGLRPQVIVAIGTTAAIAARQATTRIPIVAVTGDITAAGLVANLRRPEANVTGLSFFNVDLTLKRFEVLMELAPQARRLAVLVQSPPTPTLTKALAALRAAAQKRGVEVREVPIERVEEVKAAFAKLREQAVLLSPSPIFDSRAEEIGRLAVEHRLIAMVPWKEYVRSGGLVAYAPDILALWRRAATYVDKILKGAKPSDLPVEQPTKFELVINLKTAKALGLTIPQTLLQRADEVIQ